MLLQLARVDSSLLAPILNVGAVGACLIILALYTLKKDKKYEQARDEQLKASEAFRKEQGDLHEKYQKEIKDLSEKYRTALEKFGETLDSVVAVLRRN
jgi:hypothetical protein